MPKSEIYLLSVAFATSVQLVTDFHQGIAVPQWLSPLTMGWAIALMSLLLPVALKGSAIATVILYLMVGGLILHSLVLYGVAHLPGEWVTLSTPHSGESGRLLVRIMGMGLWLLSQKLLAVLFRWLNVAATQQSPHTMKQLPVS